MPHQLLPPNMPGMNQHFSPGGVRSPGYGQQQQNNSIHSPPHPRYPHPAAASGPYPGPPGPPPGPPYSAYPPRHGFGYPQMPTAPSQTQLQGPGPASFSGAPPRQLPYRRFQSAPQPAAAPQQVSPPRPKTSLVQSRSRTAAGGAVSDPANAKRVVEGGKQVIAPNDKAAPLPRMPTSRSIEHSDSAEDIAASALLMCGGVGRGTKMVPVSSIKRDIGSPSFEIGAAGSGSSLSRQSSNGSGVHRGPGNAAAPASAAPAKAGVSGVGGGPCHVSPVSTASSVDAADATATPSTLGGTGSGGGNSRASNSTQQLTHLSQVCAGEAISARVGPPDAAHSATSGVIVGNEPPPPPSVIKLPHFPSLLHDVLSRSRHAGTVLEWLPHGQGWRVLRWDDMVSTVLPEHFPDFIDAGGGHAGVSGGAQSRDEEDESGKNGADDVEKKMAYMNSFLGHVRAWGFREVRDVGPDMGSYRHSLFLRGNPTLSQQMRLTGPFGNSPKPLHAASSVSASSSAHASFSPASTEGSADAVVSTLPALQVPSLTVSNHKRKIGQVVSGDSATTTASPQHLFQQQQGGPTATTAQHHRVRKISDAHQHAHAHVAPGIFRHAGLPPLPAVPGGGGGGGRISSSRGRNRRLAAGGGGAVPMPGGGRAHSSGCGSFLLPVVPSSSSNAGAGAAASRAAVDRRVDETEPRQGPSPANAPPPPPTSSFPVSTRGKGSRGRGVLRAPLPPKAHPGAGTGAAAPSQEVYSVGERVLANAASSVVGKGWPQQGQGRGPSAVVVPPPMMMKGVSATPQYHGVAVAVSRKTKKARLQGTN